MLAHTSTPTSLGITMSAAHRNPEAAALLKIVHSSLIVKQLQTVLKAEGQPASGLKNSLQRRLAAHIEQLANKGDVEALQRIKARIYETQKPSSPSRTNTPSASYTVANNLSNSIMATMNQPLFNQSSGAPYASHIPSLRIHFRESPFYTVLTALSKIEQCPVMATHRNQVKTIVSLSTTQVQQLNSDKSYRCMVYCATIDGMTAITKDTDIAFPHQVELRVNDNQVQGLNLRGLKNRPGSTRPADITDSLTKRANYRNEVTLTYALTQKKFAFLVNLVRLESVEKLVDRLRAGDYIAKENVIADMVKKNEDSDLVATSTIMSLKCPLSTLRIDLPVRSKMCTHMQCFDATSFLQLQQQAPTWTCPACNKAISFNLLVVDRYFGDILESTPKSVESVVIDVDGRWSVAAQASNTPMPESSDDEDDREIVEISDKQVSKVKQETSPQSASPIPINGEPLPFGDRAGGVSHKRPVSQVIDLTLSDDEEPVRPAKRIAFHTPSSTSADNCGGFSRDIIPLARLSSSGRSPLDTPDPPLGHKYG
ncbi:E3 SUMO-protein ligase pli1 [Rhizina undulata]